VAIKEMGGPEIEWKGGRTDFLDGSRVPPRFVSSPALHCRNWPE